MTSKRPQQPAPYRSTASPSGRSNAPARWSSPCPSRSAGRRSLSLEAVVRDPGPEEVRPHRFADVLRDGLELTDETDPATHQVRGRRQHVAGRQVVPGQFIERREESLSVFFFEAACGAVGFLQEGVLDRPEREGVQLQNLAPPEPATPARECS